MPFYSRLMQCAGSWLQIQNYAMGSTLSASLRYASSSCNSCSQWQVGILSLIALCSLSQRVVSFCVLM